MKKLARYKEKNLVIILAISLSALILLSFRWPTDTALALSQNTTLTATKDKYIDNTGGFDNWSTGGRTYLYVGYNTGTYGVEQTVLGFDLSSIPGPITSVSLRLYAYSIPEGSVGATVNIYGSNNDGWVETDSVRPSCDTILCSSVSTSVSTTDFTLNSFNTTAMTNYFEAQRTGDDLATVIMSPVDTSNANETSFVSSEDGQTSYRPQLVITYTEPSASLSSSALTESSINGATVNLTLDAMTFADASLSSSNFSITGAPFTVSNVSYESPTQCALTIGYNGADFDSNKSFGITIAGSELSTGSSVTTANTLSVAATNDAESLTLSGSATECAENGATITVTLAGGQFANTVTPANWTVSNLPAGVTKGAVTRTDATHVTIALSGNATKDYDTNITNVTVSCTAAEYVDSTGGGGISANSGVTLTAINDAESLSISDDGSVTEGAENGEVITATISGGSYADSIIPANWTVTNLPAGVSVGSVIRMSNTQVAITLSGNATVDYDIDITDVTVSCTADEYVDSAGGADLSDSTGITLTALIERDAQLSASPALTESNFDGGTANITLVGITFADASLDKANFTVSGAPFTVSDVSYTDAAHCSITFAYGGGDFDTNQSFSITVAGAELSDGIDCSTNTLGVTATNDPESISLSGSAAEGAENGASIAVTLTGGRFASTLTPGNWSVLNLPDGVAVGSVMRTDDTHVYITLSGSATADYDTDITNVTVSCTNAEYTDSTGGGTLLASSGVTLAANNDAESLSIDDDGLITEGQENGEVITVTISGGTFADTVTPVNWTVANLPEGVGKGSVTRISNKQVDITLSGNATKDYDVNITNVTVSCTAAEYSDNAGGGTLAAGSGVTLTAINDIETLSLTDDGSISEGAEDGEAITATISGGQFAGTITPANWTVSNLPQGVAKSSVTRKSDTEVEITLSGNAIRDYDNDITDVTVSCTSDEYIDSTDSTGLSVNSGVTITANNDVETVSLSNDGSVLEGAENGEVLTATISNGEFTDTISPANWTVSNLPSGVSKGSVIRVDSHTVTIALSGNATVDYDTDITVTVICTASEYTDSTGGGSLTSSGVAFTANNDAESLSVSDDGSITEKHESGETITVTITGGRFADTITPSNWAVANLTTGVSIGSVTSVDDHTVTITLSGNSTVDYDTDITDVSISCTSNEYIDSAGNGSLSATGITLTAVIEPEAVLSAPVSLTEENIGGTTVNILLKGMTFTDSSLDKANFTANAPFTVTGVAYSDNTHCTLTIASNGGDFDSARYLEITIAASELLGESTTVSNRLAVAATDDAESLSIHGGVITEGSENGQVITATISGGTFASAITSSNWTVMGLPGGVSKGSVIRKSNTQVEITLSGNSTSDFDSDLAGISVSCTGDEYADNTGGGSLSTTGIVITAVNDTEQLSISGSIAEGAENGAVITVKISGGQYASVITPANWTVSNLPQGVSKGAIARIDEHTVSITLLGNARWDYDEDITNVSVTCSADEYKDNTNGGSLTAANGVTLKAVNDIESLTLHDDGKITEGKEDGEVITVLLSGGQFATLDEDAWTVANLPEGVSVGSVLRVDDRTVRILLSGNTEEDYDSDIRDFSVTCAASQYFTGTQPLSANSGVVLLAIDEPDPSPTEMPDEAATPTPAATLTATQTASSTVTPAATLTATSSATPTVSPAETATQTPNNIIREITGVLLDSNGNPMAGYIVELHSDPVTTVTDSQGRYTFQNVAFTEHTLTVKTPEGKKISSFKLSFTEGENFDTSVTNSQTSITYTPATIIVNINVTIVEDKSGASISEVTDVSNMETVTESAWWIWVLIVVLAGLAAVLIIWLVRKMKK